MTVKIVTDSSADVTHLPGVDLAVAPLKIVTARREYVDDHTLDVEAMVADLTAYKGRSSTSCPNHHDWLRAFGEAEQVICVTLTGTLSGSYNSACMAGQMYMEEHPDRWVGVLDSQTTGPELALMVEWLCSRLAAGEDPKQVYETFDPGQTGLLFMLSSLNNLANNGRVSPLVAKVAGTLGIRIVGKANDKGDLEVLHKCRGESRGVETLFEGLTQEGYRGGQVKIAHCMNAHAAEALKQKIIAVYPGASVTIYPTGGLCSFYAESGGLLVGFTVE